MPGMVRAVAVALVAEGKIILELDRDSCPRQIIDPPYMDKTGIEVLLTIFRPLYINVLKSGSQRMPVVFHHLRRKIRPI